MPWIVYAEDEWENIIGVWGLWPDQKSAEDFLNLNHAWEDLPDDWTLGTFEMKSHSHLQHVIQTAADVEVLAGPVVHEPPDSEEEPTESTSDDEEWTEFCDFTTHEPDLK